MWNPARHRGRAAEYSAYAGILLVCVAFVPDVFDGTFLKPVVLYAMCAAVVTVLVVRLLDLRSFSPPFGNLHIFFLLYIIACALSFFFAFNQRLAAQSVLLRCCYFVLFAWSYELLGVRRTAGALLVVSAVVSAVALVHLILPGTSALYPLAKQLSTLSTFGNQSYFAGFLVLVLPLIAAELLSRRLSGGNVLLPSLLAVAVLYLLVVTGSRSAWVAAVAGMLLFFALTLRNRKAFLGSVIAGVAIVAGIYFLFRPAIDPRIDALFAGGPQSSVVRRLPFYEGALNAFSASPVAGNGAGNFPVFIPRFRPSDYWMVKSEDIVAHAHNEFLEVLSETGMLGFASFVLLLGAIVAALFRRRREAGETGGIIIAGVIAAVAAVLIDNLSSMNLQTIPVAAGMWMLLGAALRPAGARHAEGVERVIPMPVKAAAAIVLCAEAAFFIGSGVDRYRVQSLYLEGFLVHGESRAEEASRSFKDVLAIDPHHAEARFYLAADLLQKGDAAGAAGNIDTLRLEYPYYPKAGTIGALALLELRDSSRAYSVINDELLRNRSPLTLYYAATIAHRLGRADDEIGFLIEILGANMRSGMKDFGREALVMLLQAPPGRTGTQEVGALLGSYREKFREDSTLVRGVDAIIRRNPNIKIF